MNTRAENGGAAERASRCARLRTKGMYLPPNPHADGMTPEGSSTAVYWCLKTMKMTGPDDGFVSPDVCVPGRTCHKAPE